jgi:DtxR family Mn-dependent transcriptional regulator
MSNPDAHGATLVGHAQELSRFVGEGGTYTVLMAKPALTEAIQDYLRDIYKLAQDDGRVSVTALAKRQRVSPASASAMVKKLAALGLAVHEPYRGIALTPAGERVALEVIRHHRLLELYLAETLGVHIDEVHDEAERLEHVLSEELEQRIDKALGFPTHDPHGDPIPDANLKWPSGRKTTSPKASTARRA